MSGATCGNCGEQIPERAWHVRSDGQFLCKRLPTRAELEAEVERLRDVVVRASRMEFESDMRIVRKVAEAVLGEAGAARK